MHIKRASRCTPIFFMQPLQAWSCTAVFSTNQYTEKLNTWLQSVNIFRFFSCPSLIWLYTTTLDNSIHPFCIPFIETKSFCQRSFSFTGAAQWNSLSYEITSLLLSNLLWRPICSSLLIVSIFSSLLICWFFHILLLLCACVWRGARAGGSGSVLLWLCVPLCNVHINV